VSTADSAPSADLVCGIHGKRNIPMGYLKAVPPFAVGLCLLFGAPPTAQSGRGLMHGYVAFDDVSYNEVTEGKIHAKIELRGSSQFNHSLYTVQTDNRGGYDIPAVAMGEYTLSITAPGHIAYRIALYIPTDFECRLAVMLKKS
jgi:hypothetical protein